MINPNLKEVTRKNGETLRLNETIIVRNDKAIIKGFGTGSNSGLYLVTDDNGRWFIDDPLIQKLELLEKDHIYFFDTLDSRLKHYNRSSVKILVVHDKPTEHFDLEVLPMYEVEIVQGQGSGKKFEAFHDELLNTTQAFEKYNVKPIPFVDHDSR